MFMNVLRVLCYVKQIFIRTKIYSPYYSIKQFLRPFSLLDAIRRPIFITISNLTIISEYQQFKSIANMSQPLPEQSFPSESAYFNLEDQNKNNAANVDSLREGLAAQARSAFVVKVYLLLTFELSITFGMCMLSQFSQSFRAFQLDYGWFMIFPVLFLSGCFALALCVPKARQFPFDMLVLVVFLLSFSYMISYSCSYFVQQNPGPTVVIAVGITVGITVLITIYAIFCKANFKVLCGVLLVTVFTMFTVSIVAIITLQPIMISIYCGLAVIIYGVYLVIITKMIIGGEIGDFPMDNYILASLFLYIYIIKIFTMILRIVANARR